MGELGEMVMNLNALIGGLLGASIGFLVLFAAAFGIVVSFLSLFYRDRSPRVESGAREGDDGRRAEVY